MSNAGKGGAKGSGSGGGEFKQEDVLQAIVVVDNFNMTFSPISLDTPRALLPLVNVPLIEYTLECLCAGGVRHAIIYCCCHVDRIKQYFQASKWTQSTSCSMKVSLVVAEGCTSVGDVLRDVESKSLVQTDFLLVSGDLVSNAKLQRIIEEHKKRRQVSKKAIMTMVYKQAPPDHLTRLYHRDVVLAVQTDNMQIAGYQRAGNTKKFRLPLRIFDVPRVQIRFDLLDCHIAVCSTVVPQLMTDNFDYQSLDDLVRGILVSEEILDNTLHVHVLENEEYAATVVDEDTYDAISQDVMSRWAYPLAPDCSVLGSAEVDRYMFTRRNVYLHRDVTLERGCLLDRNVIVGKDSVIGHNSHVVQTVIGKRCRVGKNVKLTRCYVFDDVRIDDDCELMDCILDFNVQIQRNVVIDRFCVFGRGSMIEENSKVASRTVFVSRSALDAALELFPDNSDLASFTSCGGKGSKTLRLVCSRTLPDNESSKRWFVRAADENEDDDGTSTDDNDEEIDLDQLTESDNMYYNELIGTLRRALEENIDSENVIIEINSIKCAYGIQIRELTMIVSKALFDLPLRLSPDAAEMTTKQYITGFKAHFARFRTLFANYVKTTESQTFALLALERFCGGSAVVTGSVQSLISYLYESDALTEEGILAWWALEDDDDEENEQNEEVRKKLGKFIEWLETAEEEDDDDDDD